jgi:hypothetical protein
MNEAARAQRSQPPAAPPSPREHAKTNQIGASQGTAAAAAGLLPAKCTTEGRRRRSAAAAAPGRVQRGVEVRVRVEHIADAEALAEGVNGGAECEGAERCEAEE